MISASSSFSLLITCIKTSNDNCWFCSLTKETFAEFVPKLDAHFAGAKKVNKPAKSILIQFAQET